MIKAVDLCNDFPPSVTECERITTVRMGARVCACIYCMNMYRMLPLITETQFVDTTQKLNLIIPYND